MEGMCFLPPFLLANPSLPGQQVSPSQDSELPPGVWRLRGAAEGQRDSGSRLQSWLCFSNGSKPRRHCRARDKPFPPHPHWRGPLGRLAAASPMPSSPLDPIFSYSPRRAVPQHWVFVGPPAALRKAHTCMLELTFVRSLTREPFIAAVPRYASVWLLQHKMSGEEAGSPSGRLLQGPRTGGTCTWVFCLQTRAARVSSQTHFA